MIIKNLTTNQETTIDRKSTVWVVFSSVIMAQIADSREVNAKILLPLEQHKEELRRAAEWDRQLTVKYMQARHKFEEYVVVSL